ncbi:ribonuclease HII [Magnetovibrio blakemorei]|uniref:Ribonuclease HII n=1 Tax=Magnetovibrio blakemorei TaxID=28181 RepID=A0A1E5QC39_9PROT|nr:ribonuclease HII [Magnetovibrio blakemorei]OEJ69656.1 ribonuclease HII [Magnetovibrio blakemorei]
MPDFSLELGHSGLIVGVDEAGRGPWAGPVVAGAAILNAATLSESLAKGLDDSKKLKAPKREALLAVLEQSDAVLGLGIASAEEIDELNILQATLLAMERAVANLGVRPDFALIDGNRLPKNLPCPAEAIVKGDGRSLSIAAASIVAKVSRDRMMADLDRTYPGYGWSANAGYGTKAHQEGLKALGVTPQHRKSFAPIRKILSLEES